MQKSQASAQPTWLEMHTMYLVSKSGMRTASKRPPSGEAKRYFTKPSSALRRSTTSSFGSVPLLSTQSRTLARTCGAFFKSSSC